MDSMKEKADFDSGISTPTSEALPPYARTWGNDVLPDRSSRIWKLKTHDRWASEYSRAREVTTQTARASWFSMRNSLWPRIKNWTPSMKHFCAFWMLCVFGVAPMIVMGYLTPRNMAEGRNNGDMPFYGAFQDKITECGDSFGKPENATAHGIQNLFVLDNSFGNYSFSTVKMIDVIWDVLLGRTLQLIAWYIGYVVFSDAFLRAIERHPTSFEIFQRIALEGPSLLSLWTLVKELWAAKSKRTKALFVYMWMSTTYIMCLQMLLGAMTGYDAKSVAFVNLDDSNNFVPASTMDLVVVIKGTWNETWKMPACHNYTAWYALDNAFSSRQTYCKCQLPDGTMKVPNGHWEVTPPFTFDRHPTCRYNYPGNNETFLNLRPYVESTYNKTFSCAHASNMTIEGKTYEIMDLNFGPGYCFANRGYPEQSLYDRSLCLPDTGNPSYTWGFSTMLSAIVVLFHFGWCVTMYIVWLDAQLFSTLVKSGFEMTPLRAAFAMAKAARRKTGLAEGALIRADTKEINQEVYGDWRCKKEGMEIEYVMFAKNEEEHGEVEYIARRRRRRSKDETVTEEVRVV